MQLSSLLSYNLRPGFYLSLHHSLMSFYYLSMYNASAFINIPNMCACLNNTAEFHYSNYLNSTINLHNSGCVSLPCMPSIWSPCERRYALLSPSNLHPFLADDLYLALLHYWLCLRSSAPPHFSALSLHLLTSAPPPA